MVSRKEEFDLEARNSPVVGFDCNAVDRVAWLDADEVGLARGIGWRRRGCSWIVHAPGLILSE